MSSNNPTNSNPTNPTNSNSNSNNNFNSALERAKAIAAKLSLQATQATNNNNNSIKDDQSRKRDRDSAFPSQPTSTSTSMTMMQMVSAVRKSEQMQVPSHMVPLVLGRGGETLKNIQMSYNVHVSISERTDDTSVPRIATITGEESNIALAKKRIDDIVHGSGALSVLIGPGGGGQYGRSHPDQQTVHVQVPSSRVGLVIGRGGETIKALQERTGARINVIKDETYGPTRTVIVTGNPQQLSMAQREIDDIVTGVGFATPFGGAQGVSENVRVSKDKIGLVIGKGGETIKQIQAECKVKLNIEQNTEIDGERVVTLSGTPEAIAMAKEMINEKVGVKKIVHESQLGAQFDPVYARSDPAYAAAYGSGPLATVAQTSGSADMAVYIDYYKKYYESMGYTFPPDFDFQSYIGEMVRAATTADAQ